MKLKIFNLSLLLISAAGITGNALAATRYITDEFEVTMRSGTSTSNEIIQLLKSGEAVTILEEEVDNYSLVENESGKKGYVLNRYLVDEPSSKYQLEQLQVRSTEQQETNALLQSEIQKLQAGLESEQTDNVSLENALLTTETELARVKEAAQNTLSIVDKNEQLESSVKKLTQNNSILNEENSALRDNSNMDWFIRGAGISLIAFVLGIIITRIRWRKQDSWGSY
jgi:SH3 domain protein